MASSLEEFDELFATLAAAPTGTLARDVLRDAEEAMRELRIDFRFVTDRAERDNYILKLASYEALIAKHKSAPPPVLTREQQSLAVLRSAQRQLAGAEDDAVATRLNLAQQRERIASASANLGEVDSELRRGNQVLNRMARWWRG